MTRTATPTSRQARWSLGCAHVSAELSGGVGMPLFALAGKHVRPEYRNDQLASCGSVPV